MIKDDVAPSGRMFLFTLVTLAVCNPYGCSRKGGFDVAKTTGVVMCEGQPVPKAEVYFEPLQDGKNAVVGKQGFSFTDDAGKFEITTYDNHDGAVVGKHRVRVGGGPSDCPCVLNSEIDVMQVEIKADAANEFEVVLKKKTGKERPVLGANEDDE